MFDSAPAPLPASVRWGEARKSLPQRTEGRTAFSLANGGGQPSRRCATLPSAPPPSLLLHLTEAVNADFGVTILIGHNNHLLEDEAGGGQGLVVIEVIGGHGYGDGHVH